MDECGNIKMKWKILSKKHGGNFTIFSIFSLQFGKNCDILKVRYRETKPFFRKQETL